MNNRPVFTDPVVDAYVAIPNSGAGALVLPVHKLFRAVFLSAVAARKHRSQGDVRIQLAEIRAPLWLAACGKNRGQTELSTVLDCILLIAGRRLGTVSSVSPVFATRC